MQSEDIGYVFFVGKEATEVQAFRKNLGSAVSYTEKCALLHTLVSGDFAEPFYIGNSREPFTLKSNRTVTGLVYIQGMPLPLTSSPVFWLPEQACSY